MLCCLSAWFLILAIFWALPYGGQESSALKRDVMRALGHNTGAGMGAMRFAFCLRQDAAGGLVLEIDQRDSFEAVQAGCVDYGRGGVFRWRQGWWGLTRQETAAYWHWQNQPRTVTEDQLRAAVSSGPEWYTWFDDDVYRAAATGATVSRAYWPGYFFNAISGLVLLFAIAATPCAVATVHKSSRTRRWLRAGRCGVCGYDRAGSRGEVCPECGAEAAKAADTGG